jgi:hypothetical protein
VCFKHGCGQRTSPRALCLVVGQPSREGGRRDALELRGDFRPGLAVVVRALVCGAGLRPTRFLAGERRWLPCRDAPAPKGSYPATGSTRRTPSARTRARASVRPAHPSAVPRPGRRALLRASPPGAKRFGRAPASRNADAGVAWTFVVHLEGGRFRWGLLNAKRAAGGTWP